MQTKTCLYKLGLQKTKHTKYHPAYERETKSEQSFKELGLTVERRLRRRRWGSVFLDLFQLTGFVKLAIFLAGIIIFTYG